MGKYKVANRMTAIESCSIVFLCIATTITPTHTKLTMTQPYPAAMIQPLFLLHWHQLLLTTTMRLQFQFHCHQLQPVNHYSCCIVTCRHYASRKFTKPRCCFFFRSQPAQPQQSCMNSYKHAVRGESSDLSQHSTNKETLSILYYNARSLLPKLDELRATVEAERPIICVTETWLSNEIELNITNIFRGRHGGGVLAYVNSSFPG